MNHLRTLKYLNFAIGAYTFVFGALFLAMFVLPGLFAMKDGALFGAIFVLVGILMFVLLAALSLAHVYAGFMVSAGRGRAAQTSLAVLQLSSFPVGTAYALYALYVCWVDESSSKAFERGLGRVL
jgi:hypothetical protein